MKTPKPSEPPPAPFAPGPEIRREDLFEAETGEERHAMRSMALIGKALCCAALAVLVASCRSVPPPGHDASPAGETEEGVRLMASSISRDLAAEGPNAWLRYFADDREFFMVNNGNLQFSNFQEAQVFLNKFSLGVAHLELTWLEIRVDAVAPGVAVMASPYREVLTDTGGHVSHFDGYFTGLAVKTKTGWRLRDAHWSSPMTSP
jgi:hypothetical protein